SPPSDGPDPGEMSCREVRVELRLQVRYRHSQSPLLVQELYAIAGCPLSAPIMISVTGLSAPNCSRRAEVAEITRMDARPQETRMEERFLRRYQADRLDAAPVCRRRN